MLLLPRSVRILLAAQRVDMRNSIDGLAAIIRNQWKEDLYAGDLFVFVSRSGDKTKVLTWDNGGFVLFYKRLEQGRFRLPEFREDALGARLQSSQLAMLLDGIDLSRVRRPKQWVPPHPPPKEAENVISTGAVVPGSQDHDCAWRDEAERLGGELARVREEQETLRAQLAALQRHVFGKVARRCRRSPRSSAPSGR